MANSFVVGAQVCASPLALTTILLAAVIVEQNPGVHEFRIEIHTGKVNSNLMELSGFDLLMCTLPAVLLVPVKHLGPAIWKPPASLVVIVHAVNVYFR